MANPRTLSEAEWRGLNPRGPVQDSDATAPIIPVRCINALLVENLGAPVASASNNALTTAGIGTPTTFSAALATAIHFCRNVLYQMSVSGGSSASASFGGTLSITGSDYLGNAVSESVALSALVGSGTAGIVGTQMFRVGSVSISGYSLDTGYSSRSASISFYIGQGPMLALPQYVEQTNAVEQAWIGGTLQNGSFTISTGDIGTAAIKFGNALGGTAVPVVVHRYLTR